VNDYFVVVNPHLFLWRYTLGKAGVDLTAGRQLRLYANMRPVAISALAVLLLVPACGSSVPVQVPQKVAKSEPAHKPRVVLERAKRDAEADQPALQPELPHNCTKEGKSCYPPEGFVRALCKKKYPGVAIAMFERAAPWKHGFVKVKEVAPVNSLGGPAAHTRLEFLEEVLILRERPIKQQQMIVDIPNSYDVLRFDGTCATLAEDEFMTKRPYVRARYAPVVWQQIDSGLRQALAQNQKVEEAAEAQNLACRGSFLAGGGEPCKDATQQLARAIVAALRDGLDLPLPSELPAWPATSTAANQPDPNCLVNHTC
jgi:hypothetical protein